MESDNGTRLSQAAPRSSLRLIGTLFWGIAAWNAAVSFNVWSRTQQFGFSLPLAPDFSSTPSTYAVASTGILLNFLMTFACAILIILHVKTSPAPSSQLSRIPVLPKIEDLDSDQARAIIIGLLGILTLFNVAAQVHFVRKFLSRTSETVEHVYWASSISEHLMKHVPFHKCSFFIYDGQNSMSYCEFYEPWVLVILAISGPAIFLVIVSWLPRQSST